MEWGDLYQVGIAQEDYQAKEIRILQSEGQDYYRPMYSMGVDNVQRPTLHIPAIASPHPRGYMANTYQSPSGTMVNAANLLQAQSNYIQQPQFDKNMSFGSHFPATYYLQDSREPGTYNVHNEVQNGSLYHPKKIDVSSLPLGCGGNNEDRYQHNVYNYGLSMAGQTSSYIDCRRTNGAFHNWDSSLGGLGDARYVNVDHYNCHQGPEAASRTHSHQEATLPNMKQVNLYGIRSENATVTSIAEGQNSTVRTSQAELSDQRNVSKMSSVIKKRNSRAPSAYNAQNSFQNGSLYHPKKIDLSSPPLDCGGNNEDRYQRNVYGYGLNMGGQTSSNNDCRRTNGAVHSGDSSLGGFGDASWVKADHCNCLQGPEAASRPYSHQEATLPNMKQVNLYGIRSENATVSSIANGQNYTVRTSQAELSKEGNVSNMSSVLKKQNSSRLQYRNSNTVWASLVGSENQGNVSKISSVPNTQNSCEVQHVNDNAAKISQIESYLNSLIIKAKGGDKLNAHEGKTGHALQCQSTPKSEFMLHVKKSQNHSTPSSHQVWQSKFKIKSQPSQKPSKQPFAKQKILKHHIMWDGFHNPATQPFGQNCRLCNGDLAFSPTDDKELYSSLLLEVAVLSCGHVFHSQCLLLNTCKEQLMDPPCFICVNG